jgi:hypothetical protein
MKINTFDLRVVYGIKYPNEEGIGKDAHLDYNIDGSQSYKAERSNNKPIHNNSTKNNALNLNGNDDMDDEDRGNSKIGNGTGTWFSYISNVSNIYWLLQ